MKNAVTNHDPREFAELGALPIELQFLYMGWGMAAYRQQVADFVWQNYVGDLT